MADIDVSLKVITGDRLRQITIHLIKETTGPGKVNWTLDFTLGEKEKKTDPAFLEVINLSVKIKPSNFDKAEATSKKGLNDSQTSQAFIAGDTAKLVSQDVIPEKIGKTQAEKVISVR
ncbi:MAG: hypothetical protein ABI999_12480 [Acidobacteriota bacterium]